MARRDITTWWVLGLSGAALLLAGKSVRKVQGTGGSAVPPGPWVAPGTAGKPGDNDVITWLTDADGTVFTFPDPGVSQVPLLDASKTASLASAVQRYGDIVHDVSEASRVPASWIFGLHAAEGFPGAQTVGKAQDTGVMQIIPANWGGRSQAQMFDPKTNFGVAAQMLKRIREAKSSLNDLPTAASMYNGGSPNGVDPWPNANTRADQRSRYGFRSVAGYIDRAVAGSNSYIAMQKGQA